MNRINTFKIISISLILVLILSIINLSQTSFATISENQKKASINVSNLEYGVDISLYQIALINYNYNSNQPIEGLYWEPFVIGWIDNNYPEYANPKNFYKEIQSNTEEAQNFYDELASAIKSNQIKLSPYAKMKTTGEATYPISDNNLKCTAEFADVEMGAYLIITENGYRVYAPAVVNILPDFNETSKEWELKDQDVVMKSNNVSITKTVTDEFQTTDTYSTADEITYTIRADVPKYLKNSLSKNYYISDKLDTALTLKEKSIIVYGVNSDGIEEVISDYTIKFNTVRPNTTEEVTFLIDFSESNIDSYESIRISYETKLNQNAIMGQDGNNNYAYLDYSNNPYIESNIQTQVTEGIKVYTYSIDVQSVDEDDYELHLSGSEYELYDHEGNTISFVKTDDGKYWVTTEDDPNATKKIVVNESGYLYLYGLDEGFYHIIQIKAPDGYQLSDKSYKIELIDGNQSLIYTN